MTSMALSMAPLARQRNRKHMMRLRIKLSTFQAHPPRAETLVLGKIIQYLTIFFFRKSKIISQLSRKSASPSNKTSASRLFAASLSKEIEEERRAR